MVHANKPTENATGKEKFPSEFQNPNVHGSTEEKEENNSNVAIGSKYVKERNVKSTKKLANLKKTTLIQELFMDAIGKESENLQKEDTVARNKKFVEKVTNVSSKTTNVDSLDQPIQDLYSLNAVGLNSESTAEEEDVVETLKDVSEKHVQVNLQTRKHVSGLDSKLSKRTLQNVNGENTENFPEEENVVHQQNVVKLISVLK